MATPPTFIQEAETTWNASTTPRTTASYSVQTGDVLVAFGIVADSNGVDDNITVSGGATWTLQQRVKVSAFTAVVIYTAVAASSSSITTSFAITNNPSAHFGGNVLTFRGSDGVGASSKTNNASGAPSLSLTTAQANSAVVVANGDWAALATSRTWRTVNSITPTSGNGLEVTYAQDGSNYTAYGAYWSDVGAAGANTYGLTAPNTQKYSIVAVEVKGAAAGASTAHMLATTGVGT